MPYDAKPLDPFDPASAAVDIEGCEDDVDVLSTSNTLPREGSRWLCDVFSGSVYINLLS